MNPEFWLTNLEDVNVAFVVKHMLPNLVEDMDYEFEHKPYYGMSGPGLVEFKKSSGPPIAKTIRNIELGMALASVDGPLPVMDVVGFGVATSLTIYDWYTFFN